MPTERAAWGLSLTLSALVVGLIALAGQDALPDVLVPPAPPAVVEAIPHVNAALVLLGLASLLLGYRAIKRGDVQRHERFMATSSTVFFLFLALYLVRLSNHGLTPFPGNQAAHDLVYQPFLLLHMALAVISVPLVLYALTIALTRDAAGIRRSMHPRVGRIAAPLWGVSYFFGFLVYLLLHHVALTI